MADLGGEVHERAVEDDAPDHAQHVDVEGFTGELVADQVHHDDRHGEGLHADARLLLLHDLDPEVESPPDRHAGEETEVDCAEDVEPGNAGNH